MKLQLLLHFEDLEKYKGNLPVSPNLLFLCTDFFSYSNRRKIVRFFSFLVSVALEKGVSGFLIFLTTVESEGSCNWKGHTKEIKCHFSSCTRMTSCRFCFVTTLCGTGMWLSCFCSLLALLAPPLRPNQGL